MRDTIDIQSNDNALFVTGQCNNHCLMCCQPPVKKDDIDFFYEKNIRLIDSAPIELPTIGITGGEPTLLGERLFDLIAYIRKRLPNTHIQILSNGRKFADCDYAERLAQVAEGMIIVGVPFHSDSLIIHDRIAGAPDAYNQTLLGLYNLAANDIDIELRIVLTKQNYQRLSKMARFISKNLAFVSTVAFMAMEDIGYTIKNRDLVWIEPLDYMPELQQAVIYLSQLEFDVSLFNLPLCLLPEVLRPFAKQSISDWKNYYLPICDNCSRRVDCCGFFSTSKTTFRGITSILCNTQ
ncbi:MAG: His-Xaa-Ser system radical SAM maturase HxsC [Paludibacteraceae bacterium]|nr:His-Xaa-Ser system radical SAM maturase HxsC [Paludibacteraceae bacterium]